VSRFLTEQQHNLYRNFWWVFRC